jgi:hypothetical protein
MPSQQSLSLAKILIALTASLHDGIYVVVDLSFFVNRGFNIDKLIDMNFDPVGYLNNVG